MYLLYVDEAGSPGGRDKYRRFLSIVGVAIEEGDWLSIERDVNGLKERFFHTTEFELKSHALRRRRPPFNNLPDDQYQTFMDALSGLFQTLPLTVFACVVDVWRLQGLSSEDPYEAAYRLLLTSYDVFLETRNALGVVVMDSRAGVMSGRAAALDRRIKQIHAQMRSASEFCASPVSRVIGEVFFVSSVESFGIQLADLAAYPFFHRFEYDRPDYEPFRILYTRLFRDPHTGEPHLVTVP